MVLYYLRGKRDICEGYVECLFRHKNRCECHEYYHEMCPDIPVDPECNIKFDFSLNERIQRYVNSVYVMTNMNMIVDIDTLVKWAKRVNGMSTKFMCKALVLLLLKLESIVDKVTKDTGIMSDKFLNKINDMVYVMWFRFYKHSFDGKTYLATVKLETRCSGSELKLKTYVY